MVGGVFLGRLMPLISHAMKKPEPSEHLLATLPVEERLAFADAYGDAAKSKRNQFAWIGMGISFVGILTLTQCGVCLAGMAAMYEAARRGWRSAFLRGGRRSGRVGYGVGVEGREVAFPEALGSQFAEHSLP